ncbi:MAG: Multidomain signal transduction protein including CheB-like methylesterase, CheR-like methyltransferase and BaeS-like histidine kinase [uncultured Cytophagales bacterium]|uniref:histidine kinase n=1 Tax=uncultured Cytophagales bacterium TaxID=158755 RepID=A0A6J4LJG1_9SPHI|nr:MAG: Multidomain signal transduction protein including CheB-like methylesterase, CheR-like methyltransferase and BaeS-like histidine kinase [uncultured Cytophagales bacterium]
MNTYRIEDTSKLLEENELLRSRLAEYESRLTVLAGEAEKAAKEPAVEEASRLRLLLDNLPQLAWTALPDGWIEYFNQRWYAYTGQTPGEAGGLGWQVAQYPDDRPDPQKLQDCVNNGHEYSYECRLLRADDGAWRWHLVQVRPVHEHGELTRWIGTCTDIHETREAAGRHLQRERRRIEELTARLGAVVKMARTSRTAEQVLRESEERFRIMAESIPHIVWTALPEGTADFHNRRLAEYAGLPVAEADGYGWHQLVHPDDLPRTMSTWEQCLATGEPYYVKYRFRRHDGEYRWFLSQALLMKDGRGEPLKWFGTGTDIHEEEESKLKLQSANHELTRINQVLDTFVYMAAHDLKSPVNNLGVLMQMAADQPDPAKRQEVQRMIDISVRRLDQTINGLLEVISVEGSPSPARQVYFTALLHDILTELSLQGQAAGGIQADFSAAEGIVYVHSYLHSILKNLVTNAIKYASPRRDLQVTIHTKPARGGGVVLTVSDNGIGIDLKANGDRIFKPFKRFTQQAQGTGVGLYIIKTIVEKNGGNIQVQSAVNVGTTFTVLLKPYVVN